MAHGDEVAAVGGVHRSSGLLGSSLSAGQLSAGLLQFRRNLSKPGTQRVDLVLQLDDSLDPGEIDPVVLG